MASTHLSTRSLAAELDREWQHLANRPELIQMARAWDLTDEPLDSLDDLLAATGYRPRTADESPLDVLDRDVDDHTINQTLGRLVIIARTDQLAGRIVLQRILPGLLAASRRWRHGRNPLGIEPWSVFDELVAVAWDVIATYDVDRRPRHIASRLVRTAVDRAFIGPLRRRSAGEEPHDPDVLTTAAHRHTPSPSDELIDVLTAATLHRRADPEAIGLLCDLVRADGSTRKVAELHGVTPRTIRTRRAEAAAHVRWLTQSCAMTS